MNAINKNGVSMFKVGDFVLPISNEFSNEVCELTEDYVGQDFKYKTKKGGFGYIVKSFMPTAWRHATPEEIAVGHRVDLKPSNSMELETLRDCDTSPNCKKYDERVK